MLLHILYHQLVLSLSISYFTFYPEVTTLEIMEYQQKYQINLSIPDILELKTKSASFEAVFNK